MRQREKYGHASGMRYDPRRPIENIEFQEGMTFESPAQFREAVKNYAISHGRNLKFKRSSEISVEAVCVEHCSWRIYASWCRKREDFVVKSLNDEHQCSHAPINQQADYRWIAKHFLERFRRDINWKADDIMQEMREKFGIIVPRRTCYAARANARKMIQGSFNEHYHKLPSYVHELYKTYENSTFEVRTEADVVDSVTRFKRFYICFESLAWGFLHGCRPVIGLDGCFLKTALKGQMLSAVGRDGNNQMFPVAWAVVEGENYDTWYWFIQLLVNNLGMVHGNGWTIISDQQKVLISLIRTIKFLLGLDWLRWN